MAYPASIDRIIQEKHEVTFPSISSALARAKAGPFARTTSKLLLALIGENRAFT